jgi:hypothetical protein
MRQLFLEGRALPTFFVTPEKVPFAGSHAYLDATADPSGVDKLAARFRGAKLVAVATGAISGIDVLDIDPRNGGDRWLFEHSARLPRTRVHETRGIGWHFIFNHCSGLRSNPKVAPGVEYLSGGRWAVWWAAHGCPVLCEGPVAGLPEWLAAVVARGKVGTTSKSGNGNGSDVVPTFPLRAPTDYEINYAKRSLGNAYLELRSCPPGGCVEGTLKGDGGRNAKLNALSYSEGRQIVRGWVPREKVEAMLMKGATECGLVAEIGEARCRATIASGIRAGMGVPYHDIKPKDRP